MTFKLRFPKAHIPKWAGSYDDTQDESILGSMRDSVLRRGFLHRDEFLTVCRWKTPRSQPRCALNRPEDIQAITRFALSPATPDRPKIQALMWLSGVGWPTASVILHLFDAAPFPILDTRALWSVGHDEPPTYTHELWQRYTSFTRRLAEQVGCDMRTLDRALWQYSKERQPGAPHG
jgi:hypothetical protein